MPSHGGHGQGSFSQLDTRGRSDATRTPRRKGSARHMITRRGGPEAATSSLRATIRSRTSGYWWRWPARPASAAQPVADHGLRSRPSRREYPASGTPSWCRTSSTAAAVAGGKVSSPAASRPTLTVSAVDIPGQTDVGAHGVEAGLQYAEQHTPDHDRKVAANFAQCDYTRSRSLGRN